MRFASLGSGSRGNSTLIDSGKTSLIIDCGFSKREIERRFSNLNFSPETLEAILVTHEHSDHISGVVSLADKLNLPIYATHGTASAGGLGSVDRLIRFNAGDKFSIGDVSIQSVPVPHDCREPCQFRLSHEGCILGVLTDLGSVTVHIEEMYKFCNSLILEFNHDEALLRGGEYPSRLKKRISGRLGHLSNYQAVAFLETIARDNFRLVVAHVSSKNNKKEKIIEALAGVKAQFNLDVIFAEQNSGFSWVEVSRNG